ncbi:MAG: hypothetical protein AB7G93_14680 [Bdellovibrionales bacterium]
MKKLTILLSITYLFPVLTIGLSAGEVHASDKEGRLYFGLFGKKAKQRSSAPSPREGAGPNASSEARPDAGGGHAFTASGRYIIRSKEGKRLCAVEKGTPLTPSRLNVDGQFAQVKVDAAGCPSEGWVSINGLRSHDQMQVSVSDTLALRKSPSGKWDCNLPNETNLQIVEERPATHQFRDWVKVRLQQVPQGCAPEGWVHGDFLSPRKDLLNGLPREKETFSSADLGRTEAVSPTGKCEDCDEDRADLRNVGNGVVQPDRISSWKMNDHGFVQIPTKGSLGNIGPCGSHHYNPDRAGAELVDNYAHPVTACVFMDVLQEWKKRCPNHRDGCRLAWGNISHKHYGMFSRLKTHTAHDNGVCIDIRPMRKGRFQDYRLEWTQRNYDRKMTSEFIALAKSKGAEPLIFNDPSSGGGYHPGHEDHLHVCFPPNAKTRSVCNNFKYDPNICER